MARRKKQEEHVNTEAWAIPYGDLITLLLAFFVVMYSMSSVNEGKYRILSDSLVAAFRGAPKTLAPINIGEERTGKGGDAQMQGVSPTTLMKLRDPRPLPEAGAKSGQGSAPIPLPRPRQSELHGALIRMERDVEQAMQTLIDQKLVVVRREQLWLEVEIRTDILFGSGVSKVSPRAVPVLEQLAGILRPFPNPVRVEGHTDNLPIHSSAFPSNWELSAARAASVVHLFTNAGIDPKRLEIIGLGEFRPIADNRTLDGRNTNRRVRVVILEGTGLPEEVYATRRREAGTPTAAEAAISEPGANRHLFTVPAEQLQLPVVAQSATPVPAGKTANTVYVEPARPPPETP